MTAIRQRPTADGGRRTAVGPADCGGSERCGRRTAVLLTDGGGQIAGAGGCGDCGHRVAGGDEADGSGTGQGRVTADAEGTSTHNRVAVRGVGWRVNSAEILVDKVTETGVST